MYLKNHTEFPKKKTSHPFQKNQPITAWHFAHCCWPAVVGRMPHVARDWWIHTKASQVKTCCSLVSDSRPTEMEINFLPQQRSSVYFIPGFRLSEFHTSLTSIIHPFCGENNAKSLQTINSITIAPPETIPCIPFT